MARNTTKGLSPLARAAAVIVALGSDEAASVYKYLTEDEIERLSVEVAKLEKLTPSDLQEVIDDFYGLCTTQKVISEGGVLYAKDILEKAFGPELAQSYMDSVAGAMQTRAFEFLRKAKSRNLLMMLQGEHPQAIAFILSYAPPEEASKIISELPPHTQLSVIKRIATLDSVSPSIVNTVETILERRFSSVVSVDMTEIGGVNHVADIMNHTDRATEKRIFDELGATDPELSDSIKKLMFVFEDIVHLDPFTIQRVLRDVDYQDLAIAIKGSTEEIKEVLLSNISARAKENILSDLEYLRNVRMRDVEKAQQKVVDIIRTLEESGEITISHGGEDAIIE